jgi:transposase
MAREVLSNQTMAKLMKLCGINVKTAFALIAMIGDINRFQNPKKLVAYLGLTPITVRTGKSGYDGGVTRKGRRDVKAMLIQAAHSIFTSKNGSGYKLRKWGHALSFRKGKKTAVPAVARKMVVAVWYLLKGYLPEIIDIGQDVAIKIKRLATEFGMPIIRALGYRNKVEFVEEFSEIILLRS